MKRRTLVSGLQYAAGLTLGGWLFYLAFRGVDWAALGARLGQVDMGLLGLGLLAMVGAHLCRALRWQQLLTAAGATARADHAFHALMVGYLVNYGVPRLGEITRCSLLYRTDGVSVAVGIGTVVSERLLDVAVLALLLAVLAIGEVDTAAQLMAGWQAVDAQALTNLALVGLGLGIAGVVGLYLLRERLRAFALFRKAEEFLTTLLKTVASVRRVPSVPLFALYTVGIWLGYVVNTWLVLRALPGFEGVGMYFGFFIMAVGAIGMSLPVPGGIGSFHGLVLLGVLAKGYDRLAGQEAGLLLHTSGLVINVLIALVGLVWLLRAGRKPSA